MKEVKLNYSNEYLKKAESEYKTHNQPKYPKYPCQEPSWFETRAIILQALSVLIELAWLLGS